MKSATAYAVQTILLVVIAALFALPLACLATLSAPLHSPNFAAGVICPPGSQVETEWYRATWNEPGERTLSVRCLDSLGNSLPANPLDGTTLMKGLRLYFPVIFLPAFLIGAVVLLALNLLIRGIRSKAAAPIQ